MVVDLATSVDHVMSLSILIVNPIRCIVEQMVQLRELLVITV